MAKKKNQSGKKGMGKGFVISLTLLIILPVVALLSWYLLSAGLKISGSSMSAEQALMGEISKAKDAMKSEIVERAGSEGFKVGEYDKCAQIEDQYRIPQGYVFTEFSRRELVGLKTTATDEEVQERCVIFAKVVARMEQLAHHDRHVFVCQGEEFTTDDSGRYKLVADPAGKGVVEIKGSAKELLPIKRYSHILVGAWQVYNLGDGCLVIGMSKSGTFSFSGGVALSQ